MPTGAQCGCRSLLLQGRTHSSAAQGSQIELIIVSLLAPSFGSESCLIQNEPGGRDGFSYKVSLEKRLSTTSLCLFRWVMVRTPDSFTSPARLCQGDIFIWH